MIALVKAQDLSGSVVRAAVRRFHDPDMDLDRYVSDDPGDIGLLVQMIVGQHQRLRRRKRTTLRRRRRPGDSLINRNGILYNTETGQPVLNVSEPNFPAHARCDAAIVSEPMKIDGDENVSTISAQIDIGTARFAQSSYSEAFGSNGAFAGMPIA